MSNITAQTVKELREATGAGMMDCKKALAETNGDVDAAQELLRQRGVEIAAKKSDRTTSQGWIGHYVHSDGKIGVLVEVRCETDFVAKNPTFQDFIKDISMHIAWTDPQALTAEELDPALIEKERALIAETDEVKGKPENVRDKIIDGRIQKYIASVCLMDQPFVKDDKKTIGELVTEQIATIGENISIGRFARIQMG